MELLALLFALFPIIATIIFWICKLGARPSEKNQESTLSVQEDLATVSVVATVPVVTSQTQTSTSNEDEIAVVLAAAANVYIRTTK
ncbi:MAG: hypothetical protein LBI15_04415 [Dysgonamonadaceae bacterium]|jgi:hypothetical protein|nr:hypothetical protein [Dysgonamonadaceae bacterium]